MANMINRINDFLTSLSKKGETPYDGPSYYSDDQVKKIESEVKQEIEAFSKLSGDLLQDSRFVLLRNKYEQILETNMRLLIWFDQVDDHAFAQKIRHYQEQIRILSNQIGLPKGFQAAAEKSRQAGLAAAPGSSLPSAGGNSYEAED